MYHPEFLAHPLNSVANNCALCVCSLQYPDALRTMTGDLKNLRAAAYFLSKTEIKFDLVSAVDELNKQIRLEFDFTRWVFCF